MTIRDPLSAVPTVLGGGPPRRHVVRGNRVGWPLARELKPFTYSRAIYPLLAVERYRTYELP